MCTLQHRMPLEIEKPECIIYYVTPQKLHHKISHNLKKKNCMDTETYDCARAIKCFNQIKYLSLVRKCAPISELSSNISTINKKILFI